VFKLAGEVTSSQLNTQHTLDYDIQQSKTVLHLNH